MSYLQNFHSQITGRDENAPKLVFLHGVMGFAANWRRIAKAFEQEYQILVYDQRGHGRSFQPAIGYGPEEYADDLEKILDELGWQSINLVGHSMGGRVALHFAAQNPTRVTRLVIEDIGPSMYHAGASFITKMLDAIPVPFASKREAKEWFDTEFLRLFAESPNREGLAAYLYANLTEDEQKRAVWRFYEPGVRESIAQGRAQERWDEVAELKMPTLVIRGEFSRDLPRDIFERMLAINPRLQGVEIAGAGHWVHSDQAEEFIRVLGAFLRAPIGMGL
jgi:pimeloyl-ACP methyl ester carboxylesterase